MLVSAHRHSDAVAAVGPDALLVFASISKYTASLSYRVVTSLPTLCQLTITKQPPTYTWPVQLTRS